MTNVIAPRYPWVICNAVTRVFDVQELRVLHDSVQKLLVALIKKVDKGNGRSPVFARRETLARDIGRSVETVYRGLRTLEASGLIEARQQEQDPTGRLMDSVITFSGRLCVLLDLPLAGKSAATSVKAPPPSVTDDRPTVYRVSGQFKDQSHESSRTPPATIRVGRFSIPADLGMLLERSLPATAVLSLMKKAKAVGKRMGDVMRCIAGRVEALDLRGRRLYAYLLTTLQGRRDFEGEVQSANERARIETLRKEDGERAREHEGRWFAVIGDDRKRVKVQAGMAYVIAEVGGRWQITGSAALGSEFDAAITAGRLVLAEALPASAFI